MRRTLALFLSLSLLLLPSVSARAQTAAYAEIAAIDAQNFPQISALFDVYNADGEFVSGLRPSNVTVYEDGGERKADSLTESAPPVQIVVAVNPGPALGVRDGNGIARFDRVLEALGQWVDSQPNDSRDDLSLVSLSGSLINHASVNDWYISLNSFKPNFRNSTPNLQTLAIALDTVNKPTPEPGMKRAVLFITPRVDDANIDNTIAPFIQRAADSKIRVFVWFVDAEQHFTSPSANAFKSLAQQTNGSFLAFSGRETFPDLHLYFAPLRHLYALTYASSITTPGDHALGFSIEVSSGTNISAPDKAFSVDVQPPNPIFVAPPMQITRQPPADDPYNADVLTPSQQTIEIIVEFPDGHPRKLKRTALYVDGQVVAENTREPFEKFLWDISAYDASAQHEIIVEAEDVLGLKKSSIGIPVTVTVIHPPGGMQVLLARYRSQLVMGAIALAGILLLAILLRGRVVNIPVSRSRKKRMQREDPLTQPVAALTEPPAPATRKAKTQPRFAGWAWSKNSRVPKAPAYLIRLTSGGEPASATPIPVADKELTFGTDPVQSMQVLDDPSIAPLHARIRRTEEGSFVILDQGSVAGTWVNYEQVTREGKRLAHGDRIHFGQMHYRFDLNQPPAESEPKIVSQK
jgi:hypothetical protein